VTPGSAPSQVQDAIIAPKPMHSPPASAAAYYAPWTYPNLPDGHLTPKTPYAPIPPPSQLEQMHVGYRSIDTNYATRDMGYCPVSTIPAHSHTSSTSPSSSSAGNGSDAVSPGRPRGRIYRPPSSTEQSQAASPVAHTNTHAVTFKLPEAEDGHAARSTPEWRKEVKSYEPHTTTWETSNEAPSPSRFPCYASGSAALSSVHLNPTTSGFERPGREKTGDGWVPHRWEVTSPSTEAEPVHHATIFPQAPRPEFAAPPPQHHYTSPPTNSTTFAQWAPGSHHHQAPAQPWNQTPATPWGAQPTPWASYFPVAPTMGCATLPVSTSSVPGRTAGLPPVPPNMNMPFFPFIQPGSCSFPPVGHQMFMPPPLPPMPPVVPRSLYPLHARFCFPDANISLVVSVLLGPCLWVAR